MTTDAPDYIEPVLGWRVWLVAEAGARPQLSSVVHPTFWPARRELVAECLHRPRERLRPWRRRPSEHAAPAESCTCGIYAACGHDGLAEYLDASVGGGRAAFPALHCVIGRVSLWGRVVECERGLRASHAYPACLYLPCRDARDRSIGFVDEIALALADYGVPVELIDAGPPAEVTAAVASCTAA
jgi:hypothetical protein